MKVELKEGVVFESFTHREDMIQMILLMITESKTDRILYKGNPKDIKYRTMKKAMVKDFFMKIEPDKVRDMYKNIVKNTHNRKFCVIYKK